MYPGEYVRYFRVHCQAFRERLTVYFKDGDYPSTAAARRAAEDFADEVNNGLRALGIRWRRDPTGLFKRKKKRKDKWMLPGVQLKRKFGIKSCRESFEASWYSLDGPKKIKSYSVEKFGYDDAYQMACDARKAGEAEVEQALQDASKRIRKFFEGLKTRRNGMVFHDAPEVGSRT